MFYSLNPQDHNLTNADIYSWRQWLKLQLLEQRRYRSDYSGNLLQECHMHEGIVTRANVPKSIKWQILIFHPFNCFLVTPEEHHKYGHEREWALQSAYKRYGRDNVIEWYNNLPFKIKPFILT